MSEYSDHQRKILHLVLNNKDRYDDFISDLKPEFFSTEYRPLVAAIAAMHVRGSILTKNSYSDFIGKSVEMGDYSEWTGVPKDASKNMVQLSEAAVFSKIVNTETASDADFDFYADKLKEHYARERANSLLSEYSTTAKGDIFKATADLSEAMKSLAGEADSGTARFLDGADFGNTEWLKNLEHRRTAPEERLLTGFPEIDYCISVGLKPGMLSLFVADVGGFKTTMMLNIALNIFKMYNENVLFVPLEMPAEMLYHKVISREARVDLEKLEHADKLTDSEFERVKREVEKWKEIQHKFVMLDPKNRLRVSDIRKLIEQNYAWFKPKVVVVDYISILRPEAVNERAPNHEQIGHMCKDLRQLGRTMGFSVISAAQLSRDAIKKHRKEKEGQQTVGSEDVRGSHDFSADSDNIFAQVPMPSQPSEKLQIFCIKARYGKKVFKDGKPYAVLNVAPEIGRISSEQDATWDCMTTDDSIQHAESMIDSIDLASDLDFGDDDDNSPPPTQGVSTDDIFSQPEGKGDSLDVLSDDDDLF
jgi:replicative DNA helicase